jgi:hypothetical protein
MNLAQPIRKSLILGLVTVLALMGCVQPALQRVVVVPRPAAVAMPVPSSPPSATSTAAQNYYAQVQQGLLDQGLLRTDGGGADTPYNDRMLAENFLRIAMFNEYSVSGAGLVPQASSAEMRRWQAPVRVGVNFGASVSAQKRSTDTAQIGSYLQRLAQITGHPISLNNRNPNFFIYIVNDDERRALGPALTADLGPQSAANIAEITAMDQSTYCVVLASTGFNSQVYNRAFVVIRAEHPDLLKLSCIHEEVAQGLGLPNDSPQARPSIFNDDQEFALLTTQDELMLRMLYNPALRPGMTETEARPIVQMLASQLVGGGS